MRNRRLAIVTVLAAVVSALLIAVGCGSSSKKTETAAPAATGTQATAASSRSAVTIDMGEFFFKPNKVTVKAGQVDITAPNTGKVEHELVLLRTNVDPAKLQREADGEANEDAYSSPGEVPDVEAGATKKVTVQLKPGKYAMICNVPGHYMSGMYGEIVVQ